MKLKSLLAMSLLSGLVLVQTAYAKDSGFFVGAGVGAAGVELDEGLGVGTYDESNPAWKIFGGYTLGSFLGFEVGYVNLADDSATSSGTTVDMEVTGIDAFAVVGLPLGPVRVFAKAGAIKWDVDVTSTGVINDSFSDDGTDFAGGIGLEFSLFSFAMRAEVEYFDVLENAGMASLGATYTF
jgi:hypothetical protein